MQTLIWLGAAVALAGYLLTIGLGAAALLHRADHSPAEDFLIALAAAVAIPALAALLMRPLPLSYPLWSPLIAAALLLGAVAVLVRKRQWLRTMLTDPIVRLMAGGVAAAAALALLIGALPWDWTGVIGNAPIVGDAGLVDSRHVPLMPGDSYLQYRTAQFVQNRLPAFETPFFGGWFISDRTPLLGLMTTFMMSAAHIQLPVQQLSSLNQPFQLIDPFGYWLYRQLSILTNALALAPAILVAHELFGRRAARLGLVFSLLSPFILINLLFHWPKLLAGFFIVSFFYWLAVRRRPALAGAFGAGAVLSHPIGILWLPGMLAYALWRRQLSSFAISAAVIALLLAPWFVWTSVIHHHPSRMLTYPIGYVITDPTRASTETAAAWHAFTQRPLLSILDDRWVTIRDTVFSWSFFENLWRAHSPHEVRWAIFEMFRVSFAGIFGVPLLIWGFISWRRILTSGFWFAALGASTLCIVLFWGVWPRGITIEAFQPGTALWICLAAAILAGGSIRLGRIALVLSAIECLVLAYLFLVRVPPLTSWGVGSLVAVVLSLALVGLLVARGWSWARLEPTGWTAR